MLVFVSKMFRLGLGFGLGFGFGFGFGLGFGFGFGLGFGLGLAVALLVPHVDGRGAVDAQRQRRLGRPLLRALRVKRSHLRVARDVPVPFAPVHRVRLGLHRLVRELLFLDLEVPPGEAVGAGVELPFLIRLLERCLDGEDLRRQRVAW